MKKTKRVLVVEDHDSIRYLLSTFLGRHYEVITKKDGLEGLAWITQGNIPDLILLDLSMPKLGGFDFLANVKSSGFFRNIPVIILSGYNENRYIDKCKQLGAEEYVVKPFNPIQLQKKIEQLLYILT